MAGILQTVGDTLSVVAGAKQTQADVNTLAKAAPQMQSQVDQIATEVKTGAGIALFLQLVSTGAICVLAYIAWQNYKKSHKGR